MKTVVMILAVMAMFSGCAKTVKVSCPDCTISSVDNTGSFECTKCTVEASGHSPLDLISIGLEPDFTKK